LYSRPRLFSALAYRTVYGELMARFTASVAISISSSICPACLCSSLEILIFNSIVKESLLANASSFLKFSSRSWAKQPFQNKSSRPAIHKVGHIFEDAIKLRGAWCVFIIAFGEKLDHCYR